RQITLTGTSKATGTDSATALVASTATFSADGVLAGMRVTNVTDGSRALVTGGIGTTSLTTAALQGGSDNLYQSGDDFIINAVDPSLFDTNATFTANATKVRALDVVFNDTDGSTGIVTATVTATKVPIAGGLTGGAENAWDVGDSYRIVRTIATLHDHIDDDLEGLLTTAEEDFLKAFIVDTTAEGGGNNKLSLATTVKASDYIDRLLAVGDGDTITVTYTDADPAAVVTDTATADLAPPDFVLLSPADGSSTNDSTPTFSVEVSDSGSGITLSSQANFTIPGVGAPAEDKTPITGGFKLTFIPATSLSEGEKLWFVTAKDDVGNEAKGQATAVVGSEDDKFSVTIDTLVPDIIAALTGVGVVDGAETSGLDNAIRVEYDGPIDATTVAASDYDVTSVPSAADTFAQLEKTDSFTATITQALYVVTETPLDVDADVPADFTDDVSGSVSVTDAFNGDGSNDDFVADFAPKDVDADGSIEDDVSATVSGVNVGVTSVVGKTVTLTAAPAVGTGNVEISYGADLDTVLTVSGKSVTIATADSALIDAGDAVSITYTYAPTRFVYLTVGALATSAAPTVKQVGAVSDAAGNSKTTDTISGTDRIAPTFTVSATASPAVALVGDEDLVTINISASESIVGLPTLTVGGNSVTVTKLTSSTFEAEFTAGKGSFTTSGLLDVSVSGRDGAGNVGSKIDEIEIDLVIAKPTITPAADPVTGVRTAFQGLADITQVSVEYAAEKDEYFGDASKTVTVTSATLDGVAVEVFTTNDIKFSLGGLLELGAHTLVVTSEDAAGNSRTDTINFTVAVPPDISITLQPGWNLISVPGGIADPSVGNVFAGTNVTKVFTWDPVRFWTAAILNPDTGAFEGRLISINASSGYWVFTDRFESLTVSLARRGPTTAIPAYELTAGFNLIGFTAIAADPASDSLLDESVDTDAYLASLGLTVNTVISFDPATGFEVQVLDGDTTEGEDMKLGKGYWVFITEDGTLIPGSD
ncbi:MAG: hypothetical protein V3U90_08430, partial [Dehalococcoidia bacterium]